MVNEIKTFEERNEEILKQGKQKGFITYEELANALKGLELDADSLDDLYNAFNEHSIAVVSEEEAGAGEDSGTPLLLDDDALTKDLTINVGEGLTSMLDKLVSMLGNFEYFYNLDG